MSKNGKAALFLLGTAALISAVGVAAYFYFGANSDDVEEKEGRLEATASSDEEGEGSAKRGDKKGGKDRKGGGKKKKNNNNKKNGSTKANVDESPSLSTSKSAEDDIMSPRSRYNNDHETKESLREKKSESPVERQVSSDDLPASPRSSKAAAKAADNGPVVTDATNSDSDEENDDAAQKKKEEAALKEKLEEEYKNACSTAEKLLKGNRFDKSAEKYTEAIEIANTLKYSSSKTMVLYNNRSAMFERINEFEKSLSDIEFVLSNDPMHIKARNRRARIFETTGRTKESLDEYAFGCLLEQMKGLQMTAVDKIESLKTIIATKKTEELLPTIKNVKDRELATPSYCHRFFEESLNFYLWKVNFGSYKKELDADNLASQLSRVCADIAKGDAHIRAALISVRSNDKLKELVEAVEATHISSNAISQFDANMVAIYYYLLGSSFFLSYNVDDAVTNLRKSVEYASLLDIDLLTAEENSPEENESKTLYWNFNAIEARHSLAVILSDETGDVKLCETAYEESIAQLNKPSSTSNRSSFAMKLAWVYATRPNVWVMKGSDGSRRPDGLELALKDADAAVKQTSVTRDADRWLCEDGSELDDKGYTIMRHLRSFALSKKCTLIVETKQNELSLPLTASDKEQIDQALKEMNSINLDPYAALIFELDRLLIDNKLEAALEIVRENSSNSKFTQHVYVSLHFVLIKCQAVFAQFNNPMLRKEQVEAMLEDITNEYTRVLDLESNSVDVVGQYTQFLIMTGKFDEADTLLKKTLPNVRIKEELKLFLQMVEGVSTNINATNLYKKIMMPNA